MKGKIGVALAIIALMLIGCNRKKTASAPPRGAALTVDEIRITAADPDEAAVSGSIQFSEKVEKGAVEKMLTGKYKGGAPEIGIEEGADAAHYTYIIKGLRRDSQDSELTLALRGGESGFRTPDPVQVTIPAKGTFKVLSARLSEGRDPYLLIQFSEPLDAAGDLSGLVRLEGTGRYYTQAEDNIIRFFYEGTAAEEIRLTLSEGIKSHAGVPLSGEFQAAFKPEGLKPAVEILMSGHILPAGSQTVLPFKAVNLRAVDLCVIKVYEDNILMFLQDNDLGGDDALRRSGRLIFHKTLLLDEDPVRDLHKWNNFSVDLSGLFEEEPGALYRIKLFFKQDYSVYGIDEWAPLTEVAEGKPTPEEEAVWDIPYAYYYDNSYNWDLYNWEDRDNPLTPTYYMQSERFPGCNLTVSGVGVTAKYAGGPALWLSATDILTAKPLSGVQFEVYNFQLQLIGSARSGSNGLTECQLTGKPFAVVAKYGKSATYLKVNEGQEKSLSRFDVGGRQVEKGLKGYIYGERGVWRPGDTLHLTMILHEKGKKVPDSHPAVMELYTPQGQFHSKMVCTEAVNGFYPYAVPTQAEDPTGIWHAYFKVGGTTFHKSLRIESIKPNRLKINFDPGTPILSAGKKAPISISANWLTGPPAAGLSAKAVMTLRRGGSFFKGYEAYTFVDPTVEFERFESQLVHTRLNAAGKAALSADLPAAENAPGMLSANILCSVEEPGGDASFTALTLPFSPFDAYVGIRLPAADSYLETDRNHTFEVAVVDKDGKRVAGHGLEYRIYKMGWSWWWESRPDVLDSYVHGTGANEVASGRLVSGKADVSVPFRINYPDWGRYLVYVKDLESGHASGGTVFVDWPAARGRSARTDPDAVTMLTFSTDKKEYEVGETATVYIPAAAAGRALVSIENGSAVLSRNWVETSDGSGDVPYRFEVTADMAPNFYLHVTLLQPHDSPANDLPIRLYGVQPVTVTDKASHLNPVLTMPDTVHPEEEFAVKVSEKNGRAMTYTLALVDEGLLDLTAFKTPDAWSEMYEREALGVKTWDMFDEVAGAFGGRFSPMLSIGGDEAILVDPKRDNRFNPVVKFLGPFTLRSGTAVHKIRLPMYVGSVRVMIVAGQDGAFGSTEKTVAVTSPLMVLPTLPRVLGAGEKVSLPVNVFALEAGVKHAAVTVKAEGPLRVAGAARKEVTFAEPGDQLLQFALEATGTGTASVTVDAAGDGHRASETVSILVRNPNPLISNTYRASIPPGETAVLDYDADAEEATLEVAGFPAIHFDEACNYVRNYSYRCTEQLAAEGINLLYTRELLSEENARLAGEKIPVLLQELYARQLPDGGFCYWPGGAHADEWVTSMAGQCFVEAAGEGFEVNDGVRSAWLKFQKRAVQNYRKSDGRYRNDLVQAYRLYTLALSSEPDLAAMNRFKEDGDLSAEARWMLASAYAVSGKKRIAEELIRDAGRNFTEYDPAHVTFGSLLRDKAIAAEALVLTDAVPEALELSQDIAAAFRTGYSTQELAFASVAMSRLAKKVNTGVLSAEITEGAGKRTEVQSPKAVYAHVLDAGGSRVSVQNRSEGPVYASLVTKGRARAGEAVPTGASGLQVEVSYTDAYGNAVSPASLPQGTDFAAAVKVQNLSAVEGRTHLALSFAVPSGWEIYNERMAGDEGTTDVSAGFDYNDIRDDRTIWYFDLGAGRSKTFRVRLRAAYEGTFVLPAVTCEAMYDSRVNAHTASGTAVVTRQEETGADGAAD